MKSKAPLLLMEQMVMLLVFALAAALCLQAFVQSDRMSRESEERAITVAQTAAETVRHCKGRMPEAAALLGTERFDDTSLTVDYDDGWDLADGTTRYTLGVVRQDSGVEGLGKAQVWIRDESAKEREAELVRFDVMWQEPLPVEVDHGTAK